MFVEKKGDAEQAELFAMGLIAEPEDNGTLVLVPCADPVMCEIHGTYWVEKRIKESKKSLDTEQSKLYSSVMSMKGHRDNEPR